MLDSLGTFPGDHPSNDPFCSSFHSALSPFMGVSPLACMPLDGQSSFCESPLGAHLRLLSANKVYDSNAQHLYDATDSLCHNMHPTGGFLFDLPPAQSSACSAPDLTCKNDAHTDEARNVCKVFLNCYTYLCHRHQTYYTARECS